MNPFFNQELGISISPFLVKSTYTNYQDVRGGYVYD